MSYAILFSIVAIAAAIIIHLRRKDDPMKDIPTAPGAVPFFGHIRKINAAEPGVLQRQWSQQLPFGIFKTYFFTSPRLYITDPKALSKVLVTSAYDFPKPQNTRQFLGALLGEGLLVAEGFEHKKQRRALDAAFSVPKIKDITPIFWGPANKLVEKWYIEIPSSTEATRINVIPWLSRCTLDIIGLAGFDYSFDSLNNDDEPMARAYQSLMGVERPSLTFFALSFLSELCRPLEFLRDNHSVMKNIKKNRKTVEEITEKLLQTKKAELSLLQSQGQNTTKKDILSILIRDNLGLDEPLSDKEIMDQCLTFLAAGHETTSSSLSWTLLRLAQDQRVQQKLRAEIQEVYPEERTLTYDELNNTLPYLNAVCKEVLRVDSPVQITVREAAKDDELCGYKVPKGTKIIIPPTVVHFHPDIWGPDADKFLPERFTEQGKLPEQAKGPYANLTFIAGPRNCIGHRFALTEMKAILVSLIRNFSFEEDEPGKYINRTSMIVMRPKGNELFMKVKRMQK